ncbi:hypothetical protein A3844_21580 [Paenibacillus helianthi]|uniref:Uncharacterized protein n=1 Tax=Paenibacillus helianthi TaxID=1349432 RepID=A0ABX3EJA8_9BACL|nr:hypothetical protein A3844_21580 [Paenibacillus helianthi]
MEREEAGRRTRTGSEQHDGRATVKAIRAERVCIERIRRSGNRRSLFHLPAHARCLAVYKPNLRIRIHYPMNSLFLQRFIDAQRSILKQLYIVYAEQ